MADSFAELDNCIGYSTLSQCSPLILESECLLQSLPPSFMNSVLNQPNLSTLCSLSVNVTYMPMYMKYISCVYYIRDRENNNYVGECLAHSKDTTKYK